jgi:D-lactate dehydrogenase (cytochrome)
MELNAIKTIGPLHIIKNQYGDYLTDESRMPGGYADSLAFPQSEEEMAVLLGQAFSKAIPVTLSSGRTGIVGGAVPFGGLLVSLERMNRFLGVRWSEQKKAWMIRVEPGMTIDSLDAVFQQRSSPASADIRFQNQYEEKDFRRFFKESKKWFYPPDPTERTAQIGGTAATNASGARSYKYGSTRCFVEGLRLVLADGSTFGVKRGDQVRNRGEVFHLNGLKRTIVVPVPTYNWPSVKNTAGYFSNETVDLVDLFIGSEGTLGAISELTLILAPRPPGFFAGVSFFPSESSALGFVRSARSNPVCRPSVLEYFDRQSLRLLVEQNPGESFPIPQNHSGAAIYFEQECIDSEIDGYAKAYDALMTQNQTDMDKTWGAVEEREWQKIARFRHALPETVNRMIAQKQRELPALHKIGTDFAVSDACLEKVFRLYRSKLDPTGLEYVIFGHVGENHVHVNMLPKSEQELTQAKNLNIELARNIVAMGGSVSGEHGIGKIKKSVFNIQYGPTAVQDMKNLKTSLDEKWILGSGTIF